jgi:hypothetical protein
LSVAATVTKPAVSDLVSLPTTTSVLQAPQAFRSYPANNIIYLRCMVGKTVDGLGE